MNTLFSFAFSLLVLKQRNQFNDEPFKNEQKKGGERKKKRKKL